MDTLSFYYRLKLTFDTEIQGHRFTLRCVPSSDCRQRIKNVRYFVFPQQYISESRDSFGNFCIYGAATQPHSSFEAEVFGEAEVGLAGCVPAENPYRENLFRYPTKLTAADAALTAAAAQLKQQGMDSYRQALADMEYLGKRLCYTPGSTGIETTAAEAFAAGQGVCQDYAHIMLALLRAQGVKARYVVGMLMGEGKSHAWVEIEHEGNWYGLDPTNQMVVDDQHIKISHGRDYSDCIIDRGRFLGFASQNQDISVVVQRKQE